MSTQEHKQAQSSEAGIQRDYEITGRGVNDQGNTWETRVDSGGRTYRYANQDGSEYYKLGPENGNKAIYITPSGHQVPMNHQG